MSESRNQNDRAHERDHSPDSGQDPLGPVLESFLARIRNGERPSLTEYIGRYPALADQIRELLPALVEIEQLGSLGGAAAQAGAVERPGIPSATAPFDPAAGPAAAAGEGTGPLPQRLGDYRILRRIGEGGMGMVYEAVRESLRSHVALKVMHPRFRTSAGYLRRFHTEARSAAQLHHTNIVSVFDYGEHDGVCYYAMQYIDGHSLDNVLADVRRLRQNARPENAALAEARPNVNETGDQSAQAVEGAVETEAAADPLMRTVTCGLMTGQFAPGAGGALMPEETCPGTTEPVAPVVGARTTAAHALGFELGRPRAPAPRRPWPTSTPNDEDGNGAASAAGASSSSLAGHGEDRYNREVARLGAQVADALAHAHTRGVLHRDIKPSNLLLDAIGNVWVTDFGLAKFEEGEDLSQSHDVAGTLRYMAPERFQGISDRRCDLYALGATLYELLTLRPAFESQDRLRLINQIVHEPPAPPRQLDRRIPRDLETIVLRALAKDPKDRFATADELAGELRRFLENRPIRSRPISAYERLWRWCKRNPLLATLNALAAVLTIAIAVVSTTAAVWLSYSNERVKASLAQVTKVGAEKTEQLWEAELARARAGRYSHRVGQRFESLAALRRASHLGVFPRRRLELRNEAIACLALPDVRPQRPFGVKDGKDIVSEYWIAFDGAFQHFAHSDREGAITLRRVADGTVIARRAGQGQRPAWVNLSFSPDGRWLVFHYNYEAGRDGPILAWEVRDGEAGRVVTLAEEGARWCGFGPDGRVAILFQSGDSVTFVDIASGRERRRLRLDSESGRLFRQGTPHFSPDGRQVGVREGRAVHLVDLEIGANLHRFDHPSDCNSVAWSGDGRLLAVACDDRQIYVWEVASQRLISVLEGHQGGGINLRFSHGGDFLASCSWDNTTRFWDPIRGRELLSIPGFLVALSADDRRVALIGNSGQLEVWEAATGRECCTLHHGRVGNRSPPWTYGVTEVDFLGDGRVLASAGDGVRLWDLAAFTEVAALPIGICQTARFRPDGSDLLTYGIAGLRLWPIRTEPGAGGDASRVGPPRHADLSGTRVEAVGGWDRQGRLLAVPDMVRQQAVLLDPATLAEVARFDPHPRLRYARLSADGRWLATSTWQGANVKVWDVDRRTLAWELTCGSAIAGFSPEGRWLVTATDHEYRLWHAGSWKPGIEIRSDLPINANFAFAGDGRSLAVDRGGLVLLVDPDSGRELATLEPPPETPRGLGRLAFSPDGGKLAVPIGTEVSVWDLRLIRAQLAEMGLDWDAPPIPTSDSGEAAATPLDVRVEGADWFAAAFEGRAHAREGRWDAASAAYARAIAKGTDDPDVWHRRLLLLLRAGDHDGYRAGCTALLARFGRVDSPETVNAVAWACGLGPDAVADWAGVVRTTEAAVARDPQNVALRNTLGAVLLRAGRPREAIAALEDSIRLNGHGGNAFDWLFLAMARHRLGEAGAARAALAKARDWIAHADERAIPDPWIMSPLDWSTRLELEVLARDAEGLIAGPAVNLPADVLAPT